MTYVFYARLIGFTAGTLVYLFLIALILGHRRPRRFERLLFFLVLSLFLIYAGRLLDMNARIHYVSPPEATRLFYESLLCLGVLFLPPLVAGAHAEYVRQVRNMDVPAWMRLLSNALWLVPVGLLVQGAFAYHAQPELGMVAALGSWVRESGLVLMAAAFIAIPFEISISATAKDPAERRALRSIFISVGLCAGALLVQQMMAHLPLGAEAGATAAAVAGVFPGAVLVYFTMRHNFLEFGAQRNLVYALSATFLALLYLALVRRTSVWFEPVLPPEATAAILLFVLIFLFEPLERAIGPAIHRALRERMDRVQKLAVELQDLARHGLVAKFISAAERRIREEFGLAAVRISVPVDPRQKPLAVPGGLGHTVRVPMLKEGKEIGMMEAASTGTHLTGETTAALEFLAEQLPAMVDLCRLIEEKLRLERELAERERLALLGQMAASVSHNLRNPLSSMKTVLQVQLENPDLPLDMRRDCALVVGEIDRMSAKLTQLLNFAKPSVNGQRVAAVALAKQTAILFRHDAERRNVRLEFEQPSEEVFVVASEDALSEALSNLIVNAIEAQPDGGRVRIGLSRREDKLEVEVVDDGPGISPELRAKIFQPFFTTKASGTGLGLSIVARRIAEMGGTLTCESPVKDGKGTRFHLTLPLADSQNA